MAGLVSSTVQAAPGGGSYALPQLTIGVFLTDQPGHRISVGADRLKPAPLTKNQGWILPAGAEGLCLYDAPLDVLTVQLDGALLDEAGLHGTSPPAPVIGTLDPLLLAMALQSGTFGQGGTLYRETMGRAMAAHLVQAVKPAENAAAVIDDIRLRRAMEQIDAHLAEDLSLAQLAATAGMSPTHFAKAFRKATGQSPLQYVIGERLERARVLLQTTALPVAEIAYRVGYNDTARFGQHFKRRFGITPGAARAG